MRLFIAEKPSLGRGIAQYLPAGQAQNHRTHIVAGDDVVTWCFGHLLEMAPPETYDPALAQWTFDGLPIIPGNWKLEPKPEAAEQINVIKKLLAECDSVVNAGDPDREGQLLVDELLEHLGNRKPVSRIWLAALDETSVRRALNELRDNAEFGNLKASAEARQRGDWLVGMNLTRAYTLAGRSGGYDGVLSVGRVQTPTLAMIANRDQAIENFKARDFYEVTATVSVPGGNFAARWKPGGSVPLDDSGRLLDRATADAVVAKVAGQPGRVVSFDAAEKKQAAPLPYSLASLQAAANKKLSLGAQEVLDLAQELYEAKLTTYPRTDCAYLPESQHGEAASVLTGLRASFPELVAAADASIKSAAWNDKKVTAHHAIIPTGQFAELSGKKAGLFNMIARAYLAQFFPVATYKQTSIALDFCGETFATKGKMPLNPGWRVVFGATPGDTEEEGEEEDADQALPALANGQGCTCHKSITTPKKTTPPARFTEGTLITAMANIHQLVDDPELKKRLKETAGIGTEATRAGIIETLKKRDFITAKGKQIISTAAGRKLVIALPDAVKSPGLTGLFEQLLDAIAEGKISADQFIGKVTEFVVKYTEAAKGAELVMGATHACPACKEGSLRRRKSGAEYFWGCSRYLEGCKTSMPDKKGRPDTMAWRKRKAGK